MWHFATHETINNINGIQPTAAMPLMLMLMFLCYNGNCYYCPSLILKILTPSMSLL